MAVSARIPCSKSERRSSVVSLTRRACFSAGHRYWLPDLDPEANRALFGRWASPYNHGHNYVLHVTVEGPVDADSGMVVNIKRVEEMLRDRVIERLDGRSLNDEIAEFKLSPPSTENLVLWIWRELEPCCNALAGHPTLTSVRLAESDLLYGELVRYGTESEPNMTITRIYEFAAAHRLHVEALSGEENRDLFGKCNNPAGHGHNYVLEVTVTGDPDPRTGMLVDIEALDDAVQELVLDRYDHRNLNCDVPELQGLVPTSEVVATCIYEQLSGKLPAKLSRIRLHETARSIFEVS